MEKQQYTSNLNIFKSKVGSLEFALLKYNAHCSPCFHSIRLDNARNPIQSNVPGNM